MGALTKPNSIAEREDLTALALCILQAVDRLELFGRALERRGVMDEDGWREQFRYDLGELRRAGRKLKDGVGSNV